MLRGVSRTQSCTLRVRFGESRQRQLCGSSSWQPTSVKYVREESSASSSLTRQQRPHPSQRLSHSESVISFNDLRCQNGLSSAPMGERLGECAGCRAGRLAWSGNHPPATDVPFILWPSRHSLE